MNWLTSSLIWGCAKLSMLISICPCKSERSLLQGGPLTELRVSSSVLDLRAYLPAGLRRRGHGDKRCFLFASRPASQGVSACRRSAESVASRPVPAASLSLQPLTGGRMQLSVSRLFNEALMHRLNSALEGSL